MLLIAYLIIKTHKYTKKYREQCAGCCGDESKAEVLMETGRVYEMAALTDIIFIHYFSIFDIDSGRLFPLSPPSLPLLGLVCKKIR